MKSDPNDAIRRLVESWCERKLYGPLAIVLPPWISNNGLTDGWALLHDALKTAYGACRELPPDERDTIKQTYIAIDVALRNRE
jgi:hypothetical protein